MACVAGLLIGTSSSSGFGQTTARSPYEDHELALATFRIAITSGQLTAHAGAVPQVICLEIVSTPGQRSDPHPTVIDQLRRERITMAPLQPGSACRTDPLTPRDRHESLVVDTTSGKRGIRVWIGRPLMTSPSAGSVEVGYYEHGLSAAIWRCAVRRANDRWLVNACDMHTIS